MLGLQLQLQQTLSTRDKKETNGSRLNVKKGMMLGAFWPLPSGVLQVAFSNDI